MADNDLTVKLNELDAAAKALRETLVESLDKGEDNSAESRVASLEKDIAAIRDQVASLAGKTADEPAEKEEEEPTEADKANGKPPWMEDEEKEADADKAKKDEAAPEPTEKAAEIPWPRDMASEDFRAGRAAPRDFDDE